MSRQTVVSGGAPRRVGSTRRLPAALLAGLLAAACASTPRGEARLIDTHSETGADKLDTRSTTADLGVEGQLGGDFQYRLDQRVIQSQSEQEVSGTRDEQDLLLYQPSLDTVLNMGTLRWIQGYVVEDTHTSSSLAADRDQLRTDLLERFEWNPADLPRVVTWLNLRTDKDDLFLDREVLQTVLEIDDQRGALSWNYSIDSQTEHDASSQVDTDLVRQILRLGHEDQYFDGDLSSRTSLYFEERNQERSSAGGTIPPGQVTPVSGLSDLDTTPLIATLTPNSALTDGNLNAPAGINIGGFAAGGSTFWNIGLENPTLQSVNLALLYTENMVPSAFENGFTFAIYSSDDNLFWSLVDSNASYVYESSLRRFRLLVPNVATRYLKIVNTVSPAAAPAALVTELEVFAPASGTGGPAFRQTSGESIQNATVGFSWRVTDTVTLGYDLFAQLADRDDNGAATRDERRLDNALSLRWLPTESVDLTLRGELRDREDSILPDEDYRAVNGVVSYRPLDTVDMTASYTQTTRDLQGQGTLDSNGLQTRVSAQLLEKLQANVTFELTELDDLGAQRVLDRTIWGAQLIAELSRELQITLGLRDQDARLSGLGAVGLPDPTETLHELDLLWRPSEQITGEARLQWRDNFAGSGLDQRLRLDWTPFPGGAVDILLDAQRIVAGDIDERVDRYLTQVRWAINRSAYVDVNWSLQQPDTGDDTEIVTLALSVAF